MKTLILASVIIVTGLLIYNNDQTSNFKTNRLHIPSTKVDGDIRIAQVTDFHSNHRIDLDRLRNEIRDFRPHLIALTGDLVDHKTEDLATALKLVDTLQSFGVPIYFVEGNHDIVNRHRKELLRELADREIVVLNNSHREILIDNQPIDIYGAEFYIEEYNYQSMLRNLKSDRLNILLSHSPVKPSWYADGKVDLILSGHTHGGQVRLPFVGGVVSPGQGIFPELDKGLVELPEGTMLYIDSGLGNSVLPIRFMNQVQITMITLGR